MKLSEILNQVNTFEKNHFLRVLESLIATKPRNYKRIEKVLSEIDGQIKNADNESVEQVLFLLEEEYSDYVRKEFTYATSQLDILIDILIRDGNSLLKREWLLKLYEREIKKIGLKSKEIGKALQEEDGDNRVRDYRIYQECVKTAYVNDVDNNRDKKVTHDEQSILNTLVEQLELSHEEVKLINYTVIPLQKSDIDEVINYLVKCGVILYSKKNHQVYVPDEVIQILRRIRKREVPDKVFRRVLKQLKDSQINLISRRHNIDRKLSGEGKIKEIIKEGIGFTTVLLKSAHKEGTTKTEKKRFLNDLIEKKLKIEERIRGAALEDKFANLVDYFNKKDQEDNISISIHGYDKLLINLKGTIKGFEKFVRQEFELQETTPVDAKTLSLYNLKPIDVLYLLEDEQLKAFCTANGVSTRGNEVQNILENYKDVQNLYLENYVPISFRDLNLLKANNIEISEAELGAQFEALTKLIFRKMNLQVDDSLVKSLNNTKNKVDIIVNLGNQEIIIFECKTKKDRALKNYSTVSRQVKAYKELAERQDYRVVKSFIVAPEFSDDFVNECGLDYELNLSLITSTDLLAIYEAYRESGMKDFPYKILLRDVLIDSGRVIMALNK